MKFIVATLALVVAGCSPLCPVCPDGSTGLDLDTSTVPFCRVIAEKGNSPSRTLCSGTLVDVGPDGRGLIMSCSHCTDGAPYRFRFVNGDEYVGRLIGENPQHDLAAFEIQNCRIMPVRCGPFTGNGEYRAYGFGGDGNFSVVRGTVERIHGAVGSTGHSFVSISGTPVSGDSGAGTLNEAGQFCGVLWGRGSGLITMGRPVSEFMRDLVRDGKWRPSASFTPGGVPIGSETGFQLASYETPAVDQMPQFTQAGLFDRDGDAPLIDVCRRRCPPRGDPPGREPIEPPIEPPVTVKPLPGGGFIAGTEAALSAIAAVAVLGTLAAFVVFYYRPE